MKTKILDKYREKYGHYNEETLEKATIEDPEWLKGIILDTEIRSFSRSFALIALGVGARSEYFDFIKSHVSDPCPFMREASFMALFRYHCSDIAKYPELKSFFEYCLMNEKGEGVIKKIETLLEDWDYWADWDKEEN